MFGLLTRAPKIAPETPKVTPRIHYTADDLPSIIFGEVTKEDLDNADHHSPYKSCAVATSLRRMFPGIEEDNFVIAIRQHIIGKRVYKIDDEGAWGIYDWSNRNEHTFEYTLTEFPVRRTIFGTPY